MEALWQIFIALAVPLAIAACAFVLVWPATWFARHVEAVSAVTPDQLAKLYPVTESKWFQIFALLLLLSLCLEGPLISRGFGFVSYLSAAALPTWLCVLLYRCLRSIYLLRRSVNEEAVIVGYLKRAAVTSAFGVVALTLLLAEVYGGGVGTS